MKKGTNPIAFPLSQWHWAYDGYLSFGDTVTVIWNQPC